MSTGDKILDLLKSSAVTQGVLSILIVAGYLYLIITGTPIPGFLEGLVGLVVGFFFGGKAQAAVSSIRKE